MAEQVLDKKQWSEIVDRVLEKYHMDRSAIIAIFQDTQREIGFLPKEVLALIAEKLGAPISQIYSVATFYKAFKLKPCGKHVIKVCLGTACHIRGGPDLMRQVESELEVKEEEVTPDGVFSYEAVRCVGCCGLAPVLMVDETFYGKVAPKQINKIISPFRKQ
jgi:NADH:ubiquinone oxidoreductase subunit E